MALRSITDRWWLPATLLLLVLPVMARGQSSQPAPEPPPQPAAEVRPSRWQWSLSLRQRSGWRLDRPRVAQMSRNLLEGKGLMRIDDNWTLTLEARAHYDPVRRLGFPARLWVDPRQALLDGKVGPIDLRLGLQQVVWGQSDGLRVLDVINPLDYREFILEDFLDSRRPLWMARAEVPVGDGRLQLLWIPYFAPGRVPTAGDEFGIGESFGLGLIGATLGNTPGSGSLAALPLRVAPTIRPAYRLGSSQGGARYSRSVGSWDLTANYFRGWEDLPTSYFNGVATRPDPSSLPTLLFTPRHERREVAGGTAATSLGPTVLRFEAGWSRSRPVAVRPGLSATGIERAGQFSGVAAVDYTVNPSLWISAQYFLQFTSASRERLLFPRNNHLLSIYLRSNFRRDTLRPEIFILTGLHEKQYLLRPRLVKTIGDHWSVAIGADFLGGRSANLFGYLSTRDRAVIELKWMY